MTEFKKGLLYGIVIAISFGIFVASKSYERDTISSTYLTTFRAIKFFI